MSSQQTLEDVTNREYQYGFVTDIDAETVLGLDESVVRWISNKKEEPQWLLDWRLKAYRRWLEMDDPSWAKVEYPD